ncbi:MAG TPA: helix-turn-helix domain-containing protein [Terriglobales bacterium]|nr:helix-turn-helix domain-containing protein [Terriglobales bacterium]
MLCFYNMSNRRSDDLVFKALADRRRREILDLLRDAPRTTGQLCDHFRKLDRCTVMQHMRVLEKAGLIIVKREGRLRWNYLNVLPIRELHDRWISKYAVAAVDLLARLKRDLEGGGEAV